MVVATVFSRNSFLHLTYNTDQDAVTLSSWRLGENPPFHPLQLQNSTQLDSYHTRPGVKPVSSPLTISSPNGTSEQRYNLKVEL